MLEAMLIGLEKVGLYTAPPSYLQRAGKMSGHDLHDEIRAGRRATMDKIQKQADEAVASTQKLWADPEFQKRRRQAEMQRAAYEVRQKELKMEREEAEWHDEL